MYISAPLFKSHLHWLKYWATGWLNQQSLLKSHSYYADQGIKAPPFKCLGFLSCQDAAIFLHFSGWCNSYRIQSWIQVFNSFSISENKVFISRLLEQFREKECYKVVKRFFFIQIQVLDLAVIQIVKINRDLSNLIFNLFSHIFLTFFCILPSLHWSA